MRKKRRSGRDFARRVDSRSCSRAHSLYWLVDGGGPVARSKRTVPIDFAFTQHLSPELATAGWRPLFLDYLHLGFTNATAFSPTDVMPLTHRAKYTMLLQSTVALALFGLVVARAVNAFK
jgi:hypothetical protein